MSNTITVENLRRVKTMLDEAAIPDDVRMYWHDGNLYRIYKDGRPLEVYNDKTESFEVVS